jgi:hypothetical protein
MPSRRQLIIHAALIEAISEAGSCWDSIKDAVSSYVKIKNWMEVRSIIQLMLDAGQIRRSQCVFDEIYCLVK